MQRDSGAGQDHSHTSAPSSLPPSMRRAVDAGFHPPSPSTIRCSVPKQQRNDSTDALVPPERVPARRTTNLPRRHLRQSPCCSRSRDHSTFTRPRIAACCGHAVQDARHSVRAPVGSHNNQLGGVTVSIYYYHLTLYYSFYYLILYYSRCSPNVLTFCFLFSACRLFHSSYCFFFLLLVGAITTLTGPGTITVCLECFLVPTYAPNFLLLFFYLMPADCFVHSLQG